MRIFRFNFRGRWFLVTVLVVLLVVVSIQGRESEAWFSDSETVSALTIKTGSADLKIRNKHGAWVDSAAGSTLDVSLPQNLYPGYQGSWNDPDGVLVIANKSSEPITLDVYATLTNYTQSSGVGDEIYMALAWEGNPEGSGFYHLGWWRDHSMRLGPKLEGNRVIKVYFKVLGNAGNSISGATVNFDLLLYAEQHH